LEEIMQGLTLALLGSPQIARDSTPLSFDTRKAVALLAYLACTRRAHSRDALAALLWPEYADARNALRRTLSTLQRTLGPGWLDIGRDRVTVVHRPDLWLDVVVFEAQLAEASDRGTLAAAVALYRDDFLAGFTLRDSPPFDEWQFFEAERLRQRFAAALEQLAEAHATAHAHNDAIEAARRRLALDPLHEPAQRALMQHYTAAGQRAAALRQYRTCAHLLEHELGVSPSDETVQLYEAIRIAPAVTSIAATATSIAVTPFPAADPLVGRKPEQARLRALYAAAATGALAVIEGQPAAVPQLHHRVGRGRAQGEQPRQAASRGMFEARPRAPTSPLPHAARRRSGHRQGWSRHRSNVRRGLRHQRRAQR
jgi:DNA-binding SARP family transcriptional activator